MTIGVPANTQYTIAWCCTEYLDGGMDTDGDAFKVPFDGTYRLTSGVNFAPSGGADIAFGWLEAWFEIVGADGIGLTHLSDYGRCLTNYGSIHLGTEMQLQEGDTVKVIFYNRTDGTILLTDTTHFEASFIAGPTDMRYCGNQNGEPGPPAGGEGGGFLRIDTGGMSPLNTEPDQSINTVTWVAPSDLYITQFWITGMERPVGSPVLNVMIDNVMQLQLDGGDILDGELPRPNISVDMPYLVHAGQTISFQNEERGASEGYIILSIYGSPVSLAWTDSGIGGTSVVRTSGLGNTTTEHYVVGTAGTLTELTIFSFDNVASGTPRLTGYLNGVSFGSFSTSDFAGDGPHSEFVNPYVGTPVAPGDEIWLEVTYDVGHSATINAGVSIEDARSATEYVAWT